MRFREPVHNDLVRAFAVHRLGEFPRSSDGKRALINIFYDSLNRAPVNGMDDARIHSVAERLYRHSRRLIEGLKDVERGALETLMRLRLGLDVLRGGEATDGLLGKVEIDLERAAIQLEGTSRAGLISEYNRLHGIYRRISESREK